MEKYNKYDIALGNSPIKPINKYGRAFVDSGTDVDIWDRATASSPQNIWLAPTEARKHNVKSSDAADTGSSAVLTLSANANDGDTITIGAKIYTFQTTLTDVDGNVKIGATASDSIDNLIAAINLAAGAGTTYALLMTANSITMIAAAGAGDTMDLWVSETTGIATTSTSSAAGVLTLSANVSNLDTVTIGSKTYTFETVLTNVDGNVLIGASASDSIDNLIAAINLAAGAGTTYATATTANAQLTTAAAGAGDTLDLTVVKAGAIATTSASKETQGVLTLAANVENLDTVTIGGKVYTFQTTLTDVDGNVLIGASASASIDNLIAAINLAAGGGTTYASSTTENSINVVAAAGTGDTMDLSVVSGGVIPTLSTSSATGVLTLASNVVDGDTVTIGTKVYTFVDELTQSGGDVLIGATASDSIDNLISAINLTVGRGTAYSINVSAPNDTIVAAAGAGDTMDLTVINAGAIATTEVSTHMSWGAAAAVLDTVQATWGGAVTVLISAVHTWGGATAVLATVPSTWGASAAVLGTGMRKVRIFGLKSWAEGDEEVYEDVILNGVTDVETVNEYVIIHRAKALKGEYGADGPNKGLITITAVTDGTVTAQIIAGEGQTQMVIYGIPEGKSLLINMLDITSLKGASSVGVNVVLLVNIDPENQPTIFITKDTFGTTTEGNNFVPREYNPPKRITGPAIIKLQGNASANDVDVSAGFDGEIH